MIKVKENGNAVNKTNRTERREIERGGEEKGETEREREEK